MKYIVTVGLLIFQDDTKTLSDCVRGWLELLNNNSINPDVRDAIESRFGKTYTTWHLLAYMLDPRDKSEWPTLKPELENEARDEVMQMGLIQAMASFETEDTSPTGYPKIVFNSQMKSPDVDPARYWQYVAKVTSAERPKLFATMMAKVFHLPPSSAGIERIFSSAGLVQSKLRNRLSVAKVGRLVNVSRILHMDDGNESAGSLEESLEFEEL